MFNLHNIFLKKLTYEDILIHDVMTKISDLAKVCPFQTLSFNIQIGLAGGTLKTITYILDRGTLYVDDNNILLDTKIDDRLNLNKYFSKFSGKYKNFVDLEKYEFFFSNFDNIKTRFNNSLNLKKQIYKLGV